MIKYNFKLFCYIPQLIEFCLVFGALYSFSCSRIMLGRMNSSYVYKPPSLPLKGGNGIKEAVPELPKKKQMYRVVERGWHPPPVTASHGTAK